MTRPVLITDDAEIKTEGWGLIIRSPEQMEVAIYCVSMAAIDKLTVGLEFYRQSRESIIARWSNSIPLTPDPAKLE